MYSLPYAVLLYNTLLQLLQERPRILRVAANKLNKQL